MAWGAEWGVVYRIFNMGTVICCPSFINTLLIQSDPGEFFTIFVGSDHAAGSCLHRMNLAASTDADY